MRAVPESRHEFASANFTIARETRTGIVIGIELVEAICRARISDGQHGCEKHPGLELIGGFLIGDDAGPQDLTKDDRALAQTN